MQRYLVALLSFGFLVNATAKQPTFEAWSYTGTDIYPSAIIATATVDWHANDEEEEEEEDETLLGDKNGWVGARVMDVPAGSKIKVAVSGDGWLKTSTTEVTVAEDQEEVIVLPKGLFEYESLQKVTQQKPANLNIKVWVNGKALPEQNETISIRSINECPFAIIMGEDEPLDDLSWLFAAYVNENHPWIDGILKDALDAELVDSFDGYQSGDANKVIAQVYAVWHVMQRRGIKYSDVTATPKSKFAHAQVVRFLEDSVAAGQANCVDGSVIFASILTKLSIKCGLVLVPGHCYFCFDLDPNGELDPSSGTCIALETTLMGSGRLKPLAELKKLPEKAKLKAAKAEGEESAKTFLNAIDQGNADIQKNAEAFADEASGQYQIVPIDAARELGIMPIAAKQKPQ